MIARLLLGVCALWSLAEPAAAAGPGEAEPDCSLGTAHVVLSRRLECEFDLPARDYHLRLLMDERPQKDDGSELLWSGPVQRKSALLGDLQTSPFATPARYAGTPGPLDWGAAAPTDDTAHDLVGRQIWMRFRGKQDRLSFWSDYGVRRADLVTPWHVEQRATGSGRAGASLALGWLTPSYELRRGQRADGQSKTLHSSDSRQVSLALAVPHLPILTVSRVRVGTEEDPLASGRVHSGRAGELSNMVLWYGRGPVDAYATVTRGSYDERLDAAGGFELRDEVVGMNWRLNDSWTLSPMVERMRLDYRLSGHWMDTQYLALGLYYTPPISSFRLTLWGSWATNRDSAGADRERAREEGGMDSESFDFFLSVERILGPIHALHTRSGSLGVRLVQSSYRDFIWSNANMNLTTAVAFVELRF